MKNNIIRYSLAILLMNATAASGQLTLTTGSAVVLKDAPSLVLKNTGLTNNGSLQTGSGKVVFSGSSATSSSFINGSSATSFYDLVVNKSANGIQLGRNIAVSHLLTFTSGDSLFLNNYILDMGTTGSISGETGTKRITGRTGGYIQVTATLNAPSAVNPGNIGIRITSTANLGSTVIRRGHVQQSGASIYRYYAVSPALNTGLNASVDFYYFDAELASLAEPNLGLFTSSNGNNWVNHGEDGINTSLDYLTLNGLDSFHLLTLANIGAPLAVHLLNFRAVPVEIGTQLMWQATSESNFGYYEVERSENGRLFIPVGQVPGKGNMSEITSYAMVDLKPANQTVFYRLKMVNQDGSITYSGILRVDNKEYKSGTFRVIPNLVSGQITSIALSLPADGKQVFHLYTQSGQFIRQFNLAGQRGVQNFTLNLGQLQPGMYWLIWEGQAKKEAIIIQ